MYLQLSSSTGLKKKKTTKTPRQEKKKIMNQYLKQAYYSVCLHSAVFYFAPPSLTQVRLKEKVWKHQTRSVSQSWGEKKKKHTHQAKKQI